MSTLIGFDTVAPLLVTSKLTKVCSSRIAKARTEDWTISMSASDTTGSMRTFRSAEAPSSEVTCTCMSSKANGVPSGTETVSSSSMLPSPARSALSSETAPLQAAGRSSSVASSPVRSNSPKFSSVKEKVPLVPSMTSSVLKLSARSKPMP